MRQPTPETLTWWRAALAGARPPITSEPQCGFYQRKFFKGGVFVRARIWLDRSTDAIGELLGDEILRCEIDGKPADPHEQWLWLADNPITETEFKFLTARRAHADAHRLESAFANPRAPIDFHTIKPTF